jgi:putative two-component system response regulator
MMIADTQHDTTPAQLVFSAGAIVEPGPQAGLCDARIAIIDDESTNIKVVSRLLHLEGYSTFFTTTDARDALGLIETNRPDLVLLDLMMPHVSGLEILRGLRQHSQTHHTPVIILTASTDRDTRIEALREGANDFLNKPVDPSELGPRVGNLLSLKRHQDRLLDYSHELEAAVKRRTAELEASRRDILHCLARAAEYRDDDTGHHVIRVGRYARLVATGLGMDENFVDCIDQAAQLHDVGKIGVPDDILRKPGRLTEGEFELMRKHSGFGKRVLQRISPQEELALRHHADIGAKILGIARSPVLDMAMRIALTHHEWWNGAGYPLGMQGEDIPIEGRITAVADVFDALSTKRCYKEAFPIDKCFAIMKDERGTHFDPVVLDAFISLRTKIIDIQMQYADES